MCFFFSGICGAFGERFQKRMKNFANPDWRLLTYFCNKQPMIRRFYDYRSCKRLKKYSIRLLIQRRFTIFSLKSTFFFLTVRRFISFDSKRSSRYCTRRRKDEKSLFRRGTQRSRCSRQGQRYRSEVPTKILYHFSINNVPYL